MAEVTKEAVVYASIKELVNINTEECIMKVEALIQVSKGLAQILHILLKVEHLNQN